jgi:hypothetical protein
MSASEEVNITRTVQRLAMAAFAAACLHVAGVGAQPPPQTLSWPQFQATTDDQRKKAELFDLKDSRLEPNTSRGVGSDKDNVPGPLPSYADFLQSRICASDIVVVGTPGSKRAFLTSHETSIFTDYVFVVTEWLRGGPGDRQPVLPATLTVTLVGGRIETEDGPLQVTDDPPLNLNQPYLLLLTRIPSTGSYQLETSALSIGRTTTALKGNRRVPPELLSGNRQSSAVLADVHQLAATCRSAARRIPPALGLMSVKCCPPVPLMLRPSLLVYR